MKTPYKTAVYVLKAQKDYRDRNTEKVKANSRAYYNANKETILIQKQTVRDVKRAEDGLPPIDRSPTKRRVLTPIIDLPPRGLDVPIQTPICV